MLTILCILAKTRTLVFVPLTSSFEHAYRKLITFPGVSGVKGRAQFARSSGSKVVRKGVSHVAEHTYT